MVFSDASNVAADAYTVEVDEKVVHFMWSRSQSLTSSTWRELKAIELALNSFAVSLYQGKQCSDTLREHRPQRQYQGSSTKFSFQYFFQVRRIFHFTQHSLDSKGEKYQSRLFV